MSIQAAVYAVIRDIPCGSVATYGQIARLAGVPNGARAVGHILRNLPNDTALPWHRVINAKGDIALPPGTDEHDLQRQRLRDEGIEVNGGKLQLKRYQWPV